MTRIGKEPWSLAAEILTDVCGIFDQYSVSVGLIFETTKIALPKLLIRVYLVIFMILLFGIRWPR
jgi:hypothetical protein